MAKKEPVIPERDSPEASVGKIVILCLHSEKLHVAFNNILNELVNGVPVDADVLIEHWETAAKLLLDIGTRWNSTIPR